MSSLAIGTMIVICGVVWGGLVTLLVYAVRSEGKKLRNAKEEDAS